jgi:hypothetical protein
MFPKRVVTDTRLPFVHIGRSHHGKTWMFPSPDEFRHIDCDSADAVCRAILGGDMPHFRSRWPCVDPSWIRD